MCLFMGVILSLLLLMCPCAVLLCLILLICLIYILSVLHEPSHLNAFAAPMTHFPKRDH